MSALYMVKLNIEATFSEKNIENILFKGSLLHFIYHDFKWYEEYIDTPIINSTQSTKKIIQFYEAGIEEEQPCAYVKIDNSYFFLRFVPYNYSILTITIIIDADMRILPSINPLLDPIDFAYYIRLLLVLCQDFTIVDLKTVIT